MTTEKEPKKTLEELRSMERSDIARHYRIAARLAQEAVTGLKPGYYEILTDNSLSSKDMAKKLGISTRVADSYRGGLLAIGMAKHKVKRIPFDEICELILEKLTKPMTYLELEKLIGLSYNPVQEGVRCLENERSVQKLRIKGHYRLFGDLIGYAYIYKPDQKSAVAKLIVENGPTTDELENDAALKRSFLHSLQEEVHLDIYYEVRSLLVKAERKTKGLEGKLENARA